MNIKRPVNHRIDICPDAAPSALGLRVSLKPSSRSFRLPGQWDIWFYPEK